VEYRLTAKGRALVPLIEQMRHYGQEWLMNGNGHAKSITPARVPAGVGADSTEAA
jgi:DNA-binding HxlR family transcriptional regulator